MFFLYKTVHDISDDHILVKGRYFTWSTCIWWRRWGNPFQFHQEALYCQDLSAAAAWRYWAWSLRTTLLSTFSKSWCRAISLRAAIEWVALRLCSTSTTALPTVASLSSARTVRPQRHHQGFVSPAHQLSDRPRYRRLYCSPDAPTFDELCDTADDELFSKAVRLSYHVLRPLATTTTIIHWLRCNAINTVRTPYSCLNIERNFSKTHVIWELVLAL